MVIAVLAAGCSNSNTQPPAPSPGSWYNLGKGGSTSAIGPTFVFPQQSQNQVIGYVYRAPSGPLAQGQTWTLDYDVVLDGALGVADPKDTLPASVTLFLWEKGDNMSATNGYQYYRWWCPTRGSLGNGNHVLSCVLGGQWTNTDGKPANGSNDPSAPGGFAQAVANPFGVGFTCGGAGFYGHGCWSTGGTVTFKINSFTIQ